MSATMQNTRTKGSSHLAAVANAQAAAAFSAGDGGGSSVSSSGTSLDGSHLSFSTEPPLTSSSLGSLHHPAAPSSSQQQHSLVNVVYNLKDPPASASLLSSQPGGGGVDYNPQQQHQLQDEDDHERTQLADTTDASGAHDKKRTLLTHGKDGTVLSEKKLRRLEKNRLSARECRRRKREATEHLEREINLLEAENLRLRVQLQIGKEAEQSRLREQEKLTQDIDDLLKSGASEAEIHATLEEFKEKYADYGNSRRSATEFHLRNIERLLMPTQTTSLVMHAIQGGDPSVGTVAGTARSGSTIVSSSSSSSIHGAATPTTSLLDQLTAANDPPAAGAIASLADNTLRHDLDPKALFRYLVQKLQVTPQQAAALKDSRFVASDLDACLEKALGVLKELQQRLAQTGDDMEAEFMRVRQILTPTQAATFLVWVANNDACMHMLNELWDRVHPTTDHTSTGGGAAGAIMPSASTDNDSP